MQKIAGSLSKRKVWNAIYAMNLKKLAMWKWRDGLPLLSGLFLQK
jgi:hypothetical protein